MTCMGDHEINPPLYEKLIEKNNVYVLYLGLEMDSCMYTKIFPFNVINASATHTKYEL